MNRNGKTYNQNQDSLNPFQKTLFSYLLIVIRIQTSKEQGLILSF